MVNREKKFWNNVKAQMKKNKVSQRETAEACGISYDTFRNWIYRDILPVVTDAYFISRFLRVDLEYLVTGRETKTAQKIEKIRSNLQQIDKRLAGLR